MMNRYRKLFAAALAILMAMSLLTTTFAEINETESPQSEWMSVSATATPALSVSPTPEPAPTAGEQAVDDASDGAEQSEWTSVSATEAPTASDRAGLASIGDTASQALAQSIVDAQLDGLTAGEDYAAGELVCAAATREEAEQIAAQYGCALKTYAYGVAVLEAPDGNIWIPLLRNVMFMQTDAASSDDAVLSPNYFCSLFEENNALGERSFAPDAEGESVRLSSTAPNDPYFRYQWFHTNIGSQTIWDRGVTGSGIVVAVIDTGIDSDHEDLVNQIQTGGTGFYEGVEIYSYEDTKGHGTHVSGIIAAQMNNGLGVVGVAPGAKILPVKMGQDANGDINTADIAIGVNFVSGMSNGTSVSAPKADIINMSLGGYGVNTALQIAVRDAVSAGIIVLAAAGNDNTSAKSYPAAYEDVISVASLSETNARSYFSNYGDTVDIAAPGSGTESLGMYFGILSTYINDNVEYMRGTSMACPVVSGVAALLLSCNQSVRAQTGLARVRSVTNILCSTATSITTDKAVGAGLVNASAACTNTESVMAFVERLYARLLGRAAEEGGKQYWTNYICSGNSAAMAAYNFLVSTELVNQDISDDAFITRLYHTFLDREPEAGGLLYWRSILEAGTSRLTVASGFITSEEFTNICERYGMLRGALNGSLADPYPAFYAKKRIGLFVDRLYAVYLDRAADAGGRAYWVDVLVSRQIAGKTACTGFVESSEFQNHGYDNSAYVTYLYRGCLGREPDAGGLAFWAEVLDRGTSRDALLRDFLNSSEFSNICAGYGITP